MCLCNDRNDLRERERLVMQETKDVVPGKDLKGVEVGAWEGPSPRMVFALYWAHTSGQTDRSFEAMEASVQLSVSLAAEFP